jgi:hypothetical protein
MLSSSLEALYLTGNNISASILYQIQEFVWKQYCQDLLCHANTPYNSGFNNVQDQQLSSPNFPHSSRKLSRSDLKHFEHSRRTEVINSIPRLFEEEISTEGLVTSSASRLQPIFFNLFDNDVKRDTSKKIIWNAGSSIEVIDDTNRLATDIRSTHSAGFNSNDFLSNLTFSALPGSTSSESAGSLLALTAAGVMVSFLLYKNVIVARTIVKAGYRLLQSCFYKTRDSLKTANNFYSFLSPLKMQQDQHYIRTRTRRASRY